MPIIPERLIGVPLEEYTEEQRNYAKDFNIAFQNLINAKKSLTHANDSINWLSTLNDAVKLAIIVSNDHQNRKIHGALAVFNGQLNEVMLVGICRIDQESLDYVKTSKKYARDAQTITNNILDMAEKCVNQAVLSANEINDPSYDSCVEMVLHYLLDTKSRFATITLEINGY